MGSLYHIEIQIKKLETINLKMYNSYSYQAEAPADEYEDEEEYEVKKQGQLSCWGNAQSMNLNPLILKYITKLIIWNLGSVGQGAHLDRLVCVVELEELEQEELFHPHIVFFISSIH